MEEQLELWCRYCKEEVNEACPFVNYKGDHYHKECFDLVEEELREYEYNDEDR